MDQGFRAVRVRSHGRIARIEVPKEKIQSFLEKNRDKAISNALKSFGFQFVTIDMDGYRMGSFLPDDTKSNN
jgi:uncharacterized protein